jgi:hypothetical protein
MGGIVIAFPGKWASAYRRAETNEASETQKMPARSGKRPRLLKARVERVTALLAELERISPPLAEVSAMQTQVRASICKIEEKLGGRGLGDAAQVAAVEDDGDSQPHVDHDVLERHFHPIEFD